MRLLHQMYIALGKSLRNIVGEAEKTKTICGIHGSVHALLTGAFYDSIR